MPTTYLRLWSVVATLSVGSFVTTAYAQPRPKPTSTTEDKFRAYRMEAKPGNDQPAKLSAMQNGNVNLDQPTAEDKSVLLEMARYYIYPVTHHEFYLSPEGPELAPRTNDSPSLNRIFTNYRTQLVMLVPGAVIPPTKVAYAKEFGEASVQAIQEVLDKNPPAIIRMNVLRLLTITAESGAPAAWGLIIKLLKTKDEANHPIEVLYHSLKAAEAAISVYDKERGPKWLSKDTYFELVSLVDDVVQKMPTCVADKTYIPAKPNYPTLSTDNKPKENKPGELSPEQVDAVQAFRIQAIRALSKVRTDTVTDAAQNKQRRPLYTLARVAFSDVTIVPQPSLKEVGEALMGIATMTPSGTVSANVLGAVVAKGTSDLISEKAINAQGAAADGPAMTHWRVYGAKLKAAYAAWEKELQGPKVPLPKSDKDMLISLSQLCTSAAFDPLSKTVESGQAGVKKDQVDTWLRAKASEFKAGPLELYTDKSDFKLTAAQRK